MSRFQNNPHSASWLEPHIYTEHPNMESARIHEDEVCAGTGQPSNGAFCQVCNQIMGSNKRGLVAKHKMPARMRNAE